MTRASYLLPDLCGLIILEATFTKPNDLRDEQYEPRSEQTNVKYVS